MFSLLSEEFLHNRRKTLGPVSGSDEPFTVWLRLVLMGDVLDASSVRYRSREEAAGSINIPV